MVRQVAALGGIDPTGAKHQVFKPAGGNGLLASSSLVWPYTLMGAAALLVFCARVGAAAIKHIVGAVAHEQGPVFSRPTRRPSVVALTKRARSISLSRLVHSRIGRRTHHHIGLMLRR